MKDNYRNPYPFRIPEERREGKICLICDADNSLNASFCRKCGFPMDILDRKVEERLKIYKNAAEQGYMRAQYVRWYRKAAAQGFEQAKRKIESLGM